MIDRRRINENLAKYLCRIYVFQPIVDRCKLVKGCFTPLNYTTRAMIVRIKVSSFSLKKLYYHGLGKRSQSSDKERGRSLTTVEVY